MENKDFVNTKEDLHFDKIKYRQYFYFKCADCGAIDEQFYVGEKHVKSRCCKCSKKAQREKMKQTCLERYGVDNPAKIASVKEKTKQTCLERYGVTSPGKNIDIKNKQRATLKEKYGNTNPGAQANHLKFMKYRDDQCDELSLEWLDKDSFHGKYDTENGEPIKYTFKCLKCGTIFKDDFHSLEPVCRTCNPSYVGKSKIEDEIYDFIMNNYKGEVVRHDRSLLNGKELDFYFPDKKVAIEFNGTWWHGYRAGEKMPVSSFKKNHEWKRLECEKLGIRLLNIDEADYLDRPDVFNAFILDCVSERKRVFARNCVFKEIDKTIAKEFCEKYHVNGWRNSSIAYGLFLNDELLCVAAFSRHPKYEWECIRLCYKTGVSIIGGWEKIQKHFGKKFLHYVNLNYFPGENKTGCGYRFVFNRIKVVYRNQLQNKDSIMKYCKKNYIYNEKLSCFQNCLYGGGIAIFDCGNDIRIYNDDNP